MSLYRLLDRVFPANYALKLFCVAFVGIHVPLIAICAYVLCSVGGILEHRYVLIVALLSTGFGTAMTLVGIWLVMSPIHLATRALALYQAERIVLPLPMGFATARQIAREPIFSPH